MAVNPLYTATKDGFLTKIRLKTAQSEQTLAVVDVAISRVRLGFFKALTSERAIEIAGFADSDNPTTDDEVLKSTAAVAEALWVTAMLIELLPHVFMEGNADAQQVWNEEPLTRDAKELSAYRQSLMGQVTDLLGALEEPVNDNSGPVKASTSGRPVPFLIFNNSPGLLGYRR